MHDDVTPESSAEEDTIKVRESLDGKVRTEEGIPVGVLNGGGQSTDYVQLFLSGYSLFVVPAHDLFGCLHGAHKGAFVFLFETVVAMEVNLALLARVG